MSEGREFPAVCSGTWVGSELLLVVRSNAPLNCSVQGKMQGVTLPQGLLTAPPSLLCTASLSLRCPLGTGTSMSRQNTSVPVACRCSHCKLLPPWEGFETENFFPLLLAVVQPFFDWGKFVRKPAQIETMPGGHLKGYVWGSGNCL